MNTLSNSGLPNKDKVIVSRNVRAFTLLEVTIASVIFGVIMTSVFAIFRSGTQVYHVAVIQSELEGQARKVLDEVEKAMMDSSISTIQESSASMTSPYSSPTFTFKKCTGYDGTTHTFTYGNLCRVAAVNGTVYYYENYGLGNQTSIALSSGVSNYLELEKTTPDSTDNNGNGLIDEAGLCFALAQNKVTIYLTLEKTASTGVKYQVTLNSAVTLRNK
jgi:prepilin-type N-terminal cleavage/methylation domain-containing protein